MYINMLNILENLPIFEWYFNYKNFILGIMSLVLSMILVASIFWQLDEQLGDNLWGLIDKDTCVKDAIIIGSILIIGMLLNAAGMELKLKLNHMPLVLFFYGSMLLFFIQLIEIIKYKNTFKRIIKITFNIYIKIIECLILMLTLMDRLESIELVVALLSITVMRLLESILESSKKIKILNLNIEKEDCPVKEEKQLFASRQRQLNSICAELKESQGEREPYAIAIAGKWGTGKTSFVNVLKKKIENAEFIHIECTIGHDVEAILNEMSLQMIDKFRDNGIYVPQNGIVEEYFKKVAEFISNMGYDSFSKILEGFTISGEKSYSENKDLMNNELENFYNITKKNIYFIIDDMDRVIDDDMKTLLFQVVRECVELHHCVTLFMIDYNELVNENMSKEFLEKYINYQYQLCDVSYQEIVSNYLKVYLKNEFFSKSCKYMINKQQEIRKHILTIGNDVVKQNLKEIDDLEKNPQKDEKKRLAWLKETRKKLNSSLKNPRKVKRYLNNIENMLSVADTVWFQKENFETNEYSKEPWEKYIIKISFLKAFLTEEYEAMIGAGNFYFFKENDERNYYINERIMCIYDDSDGIYEISMNGILEELVYHLYIMDIDLYKSKHQELTNEIDNEKLKEKNILQYIEICMGIQIDFVRTNKVLDYIIESNIEDKDNLLKIINCIINRINFNDYNLRKNYIVEIIKKINFIVNENSLIISAGTFKNAMIEKQDEFILRYSTYIYNVLKIFYDQFDDRTYQIDSISNLYQLIVKIEAKNKKDNVVVWETIDSIIIQIRYLKNYFKNLERKINTPEYFDVKKQGLYFLKPILRMLEILDIILEDNKKYYNNVDLVNYSNVKDLTDFLNKMREEILNEKNDEEIIRGREILKKIIYKVEPEFNKYSDLDKEKISELLYWLYEELSSRIGISQEEKFEWNTMGIKLFRLKKYKKYWEPRGIRYRI